MLAFWEKEAPSVELDHNFFAKVCVCVYVTTTIPVSPTEGTISTRSVLFCFPSNRWKLVHWPARFSGASVATRLVVVLK